MAEKSVHGFSGTFGVVTAIDFTDPVYRQMEKLELRKKEAVAKLAELNDTGVIRDEPSDLKILEKFTTALKEMLASNDESKEKA